MRPELFPSVIGPASARGKAAQRASYYSGPPSICLQCSLQPHLRRYSTTNTPPKGSPDGARDKIKPNSPATPSPDPTRSPSSASDPDLPSSAESSRHSLSARFSTFMDNLQSRVFVASQTLNDLTGYSAIEAIKARNASLEESLHTAQSRLREARHSYKDLTSRRAATQREVTTLLARKDSWAPPDLERFTVLYRLDHELEASVGNAAAELSDAEADEDRLSSELNAGILKRYHEEQIWSDRIRRQSTWGTWGLMGVNVLLFLGFQFVAEPWRRKRLVKGIAEGERGALDELRGEVAALRGVLTEMSGSGRSGEVDDASVANPTSVSTAAASGETAAVTPLVPGESSPTWTEVLSEPARWRPALRDLYSERRIDLRMKDATAIAIESAAAGAVIAAGIAFTLLRRT